MEGCIEKNTELFSKHIVKDEHIFTILFIYLREELASFSRKPGHQRQTEGAGL